MQRPCVGRRLVDSPAELPANSHHQLPARCVSIGDVESLVPAALANMRLQLWTIADSFPKA